jgi:hypothetical protein
LIRLDYNNIYKILKLINYNLYKKKSKLYKTNLLYIKYQRKIKWIYKNPLLQPQTQTNYTKTQTGYNVKNN